jgi:hypothetical protein
MSKVKKKKKQNSFFIIGHFLKKYAEKKETVNK